MKLLLRIFVLVALGAAAASLDLTLWAAWRNHTHETAIVVASGPRGNSRIDALTALAIVTAVSNAVLMVTVVSFAFPDAFSRFKHRLDELPPSAEHPPNTAPPPDWSCPHCQQANPANFDQCWKCQQFRERQLAVSR